MNLRSKWIIASEEDINAAVYAHDEHTIWKRNPEGFHENKPLLWIISCRTAAISCLMPAYIWGIPKEKTLGSFCKRRVVCDHSSILLEPYIFSSLNFGFEKSLTCHNDFCWLLLFPFGKIKDTRLTLGCEAIADKILVDYFYWPIAEILLIHSALDKLGL